MATINYAAETLQPANSQTYVAWTPMANGDSGQEHPSWPGADRSIQVLGTFGTGGTVLIEGSNDKTSPTNWATLRDPAGNNLSITSAGIKQVLEFTRWIRPRVSAGDGTTSITVQMLVAR